MKVMKLFVASLSMLISFWGGGGGAGIIEGGRAF